MLEQYNIILGSQSPRRKELLKGLDLKFTTLVVPGKDEIYPDGLSAEEIPVFLARQKAEAYTLGKKDLLITADTIVWLNGKVYGKPHSKEEAVDMLRQLSGATHQVITGVCVTTTERTEAFAAVTDVTFDSLTESEIEYYVDKYHPSDKAGSYGVQEWIGYIGVSHINGSYFNIMGLPVQRLYTLLKTF